MCHWEIDDSILYLLRNSPNSEHGLGPTTWLPEATALTTRTFALPGVSVVAHFSQNTLPLKYKFSIRARGSGKDVPRVSEATSQCREPHAQPRLRCDP